MRLWRICRKPFAKNPLSGEGGQYASGRWHTAPRLVVYSSESLALACLEVLAHVDPDLTPQDFVAIEIDVPSVVPRARLTHTNLPRFWRRYPGPQALQRLGNTWLDSRMSTILQGPSVIIPAESNFLINPMGPDFRLITVVAKSSFTFNSRLIGRGP